MTFDLSLIAAFLQVMMIDLVLAGDNAIVIGLAAAGLPPEQRRKASAPPPCSGSSSPSSPPSCCS